MGAAQSWNLPSDGAIDAILGERIEAERQGVGIVAGVIDRDGRRIVAHGVRRAGGAEPVHGRSVFEIGSISKVFTSLLLADLALKGEVALDDPVGRFLPAHVAVPERNGRQITLLDLAIHRSALPRMPSNFAPAEPDNPYADYDVELLYAFLNGHALGRNIGARFEYSNLAVGLLGHALERVTGTDYESLVRQRITGPLGMHDTVLTLTPALKRRLATGHDAALKPVGNWDLAALAGAGGLRSTAEDMLTFAAAELGYLETPLKAAMEMQRRPRASAGTKQQRMALGWVVRRRPEGAVVWHNGGTGGYRAFLGLDVRRRRGVVVLANVSSERGGDDIGLHILTGSPLAPAPVVRQAVELPPQTLDRFTGLYRLGRGRRLALRREGGRLFAHITDQGEAEIFAEAEGRFFWRAADAQLSIEPGSDGAPAAAIIHQSGRDIRCERIPPPLRPQKKGASAT